MGVSNKDREQAKKWLRNNGKCASEDKNGGFICNQTANHVGRNHKAQIFGGVDDGKTLKEWPW